MDRTDLARLAEGLTKAQRRLVLGLGREGVHVETLLNEPQDIMAGWAEFAKGHILLREEVGGRVLDRFASRTLSGLCPAFVDQPCEQSGFR